MIEAIGIDLIEIKRIADAIKRYGDRFTNRVFTPWEIQYCLGKIDPYFSFAGRFAVKEAVFKAIGTGFADGVKWASVEVVNDPSGQPQVRLGQAIRNHIGEKKILISLSHTKEHAVAAAVLFS
jgi:holo-[acyl-carrier protein] synthase